MWRDGVALTKLTFGDVKSHGDISSAIACDVSAWQVGNASPKNTVSVKTPSPEPSVQVSLTLDRLSHVISLRVITNSVYKNRSSNATNVR